jgi:shikimate kinase
MRIFLIGFMGAGKSYLGKQWAEDNGMLFYDLDTLIEIEERKTIEKIFSENSEAYFRELEAAVLRNTERFDNAIIACGGGAACFFDNMHWMNKNGVTVFLNETIENIFHHLINDKKQRPLLLETITI